MAHFAPPVRRRTRSRATLVLPLLAFALVSLVVGLVARSTELGPKH